MVAAARHLVAPVAVGQIPFDRAAQAGLEGDARAPAEFALDLLAVDGIALVVPGAVLDEADQALMWAIRRVGHQLVQQGTDRASDLDVGALAAPADVVGLARAPLRQGQAESRGMVFDEEPVTHVVARPVDWQRLTRQRLEDEDRDQLLRELIGAVIVGAVGDQHRQAVGVMPGAHQVVRTGLAGRIGRVWLIGRGLGEIALGAQTAIDLVG